MAKKREPGEWFAWYFCEKSMWVAEAFDDEGYVACTHKWQAVAIVEAGIEDHGALGRGGPAARALAHVALRALLAHRTGGVVHAGRPGRAVRRGHAQRRIAARNTAAARSRAARRRAAPLRGARVAERRELALGVGSATARAEAERRVHGLIASDGVGLRAGRTFARTVRGRS